MSTDSSLLTLLQVDELTDGWRCRVQMNGNHPLIDEHRVYGQRVIAGAFWLELLMFTVSTAAFQLKAGALSRNNELLRVVPAQAGIHLNSVIYQTPMLVVPAQAGIHPECGSEYSSGREPLQHRAAYQIHNLVWLSPLQVERQDIFVVLDLLRVNQGLSVTISSQMNGSERIHAKARMLALTEVSNPKQQQLSISAIQAREHSLVESHEIEDRIARLGFDYGPRYRLIHQAWCAPTFCLTELKPFPIEEEGLLLHPPVIDAGLQSCLGIRYGRNRQTDQNEKAHLPFSLQWIKTYRSLVHTRYVYVLVDGETSETYQILFLDEEGKLLMMIRDFTGRHMGIETR